MERCLGCDTELTGAVIRRHFCSSVCARSLQGRLWLRTIRRTRDECWLWTGSRCGSRASGSYGQISYLNRKCLAHRISWYLHHGPVPPGLLVLHDCDNPLCVNPRHLKLGTHADNTQDMIAKGRGIPKGRHPKTQRDIKAMMRMRKTGVRVSEIAAELGVSQAYVSRMTAPLCGTSVGPLPGTRRHTGPRMPQHERELRVAQMLDMRLRGMPLPKIAAEFGVSKVHVSRLTSKAYYEATGRVVGKHLNF